MTYPESRLKRPNFPSAATKAFWTSKSYQEPKRKCRQDSGNAGVGLTQAAVIVIRERRMPVSYFLVTVTVKLLYMVEVLT